MMNAKHNEMNREYMDVKVQLFHGQDENKREMLREHAYEMMHDHEGNYFGVCVETE